MVALGFYWVGKRLASFFFRFLNHGLREPNGFQKTRSRDLFDPGCAAELSTIDYLVSAKVTAEAAGSDAAAMWEPVSESESAWALRLLLALLIQLPSLLALPLLLLLASQLLSLWV